MTPTESQVIGAVVFDANRALFVAIKSGVTAESFPSPDARQIWGIIADLHQSGKPVDLPAVCERTPGSPDLEASIRSAVDQLTTVAHCEFHVKELRRQERARRGLAIIQQAAEAMPTESDTDAIIETTATELIRLNQREDIPIQKLGDLKADKLLQWEAAANNGFVGVPFCLPKVNRILGGWRNGTFSIIAGYRGEGKSTICRQDAYTNSKAGRKVLLFSLEDPADMAAAAIAGMHSGVNTFFLDTGQAYPGSQAKILNGWAEIADLPLWIVSRNIGLNQIQATIELMNMRHGIDIVYIDHIQYVTPLVLTNMNRTNTLAHYSLTLSGLAKRLNIPIVALSQLSRDCEKNNRKPRLSDLRDSGSLEQDARQVLILYWDSEKDHHVIEVAKNNYGQSNKAVDVWRWDGKHKFAESQELDDGHRGPVVDRTQPKEYGHEIAADADL